MAELHPVLSHLTANVPGVSDLKNRKWVRERYLLARRKRLVRLVGCSLTVHSDLGPSSHANRLLAVANTAVRVQQRRAKSEPGKKAERRKRPRQAASRAAAGVTDTASDSGEERRWRERRQTEAGVVGAMEGEGVIQASPLPPPSSMTVLSKR